MWNERRNRHLDLVRRFQTTWAIAPEPDATDASMLLSHVDRVTPNPQELAQTANNEQLFQYLREPVPAE